MYKLPDIIDTNGDDYSISIFLGDLVDMIAFNEMAHQLQLIPGAKIPPAGSY